MSIHAMKRKGVIQYGSRRSGKPPGGIWQDRGPFGKTNSINSISAFGPEGFSINGGSRNPSYIGRSMAMSKTGTRFNGAFPIGYGGNRGRYVEAEPLFNMPPAKAHVEGSQKEYIKPSVLSQRGQLATRFKWIQNGTYPNYWVQPIYPSGSLSDNASQQLYVENKWVANLCVQDINDPAKYEGYEGANACECQNSVIFPYTKTLYQPMTAEEYVKWIQRKIVAPKGHCKPFPMALNHNHKSSVPFGQPPSTPDLNWLTPPLWYLD